MACSAYVDRVKIGEPLVSHPLSTAEYRGEPRSAAEAILTNTTGNVSSLNYRLQGECEWAWPSPMSMLVHGATP